MGFSDDTKNNLKPHYTNQLVEKFYKPLLFEAELYQRVSGYFTTSGVDLYIDGIEELAKNGGKAQFVISKTISEDEYSKIKQGYDLYEDLRPLKLAERNEKLNSKVQSQLGNLAFMIAMGRARVKVALTNKGLFHDKFGIITSNNEKVFFTGSANETHSGISVNYESISVDVSWDSSENVIRRIHSNVERFNRLWSNTEPGVKVVEVSELAYEEIAKYQSQAELQISDINKDEKQMEDVPENSISFQLIDNQIIRVDNSIMQLTNNDRKLMLGSDLTIFFESDNRIIKESTTYKDIERIIEITKVRAKRKNIPVFVSEAVKEYIARNKYSIEQYKIIGDVFKGEISNFPNDKIDSFEAFTKIVQSEVSRPLYDLHLRAAYYQYEMSRGANFSVPGAGKTAMVLGVFAYLNRRNIQKDEKVDRILVICPLSAFESWKHEFKQVFGNKKTLKVIDSQDSKNFEDELNLNWKVSNLILVNYESLPKYYLKLIDNLDNSTMLVFDEVHRIKNPDGVRASAALEISRIPKFKYVLTGTPIPNSYRDIYNFLNILYSNEYNSYFGWDLDQLDNPRIREINKINKKLYPFFWRTNKKDLNVPKPEEDIIDIVEPTEEQLELAEAIYFNEKSSLAKLIRLIQASTNPSLINEI